MEILDTIATILEEKESNQIWTIEPNDSVYQAITLMSLENVGALPVMEAGVLLGIISERDYTRKVILKGRSSMETNVHEIMTTPVYCIPPSAKVIDSLHLMISKEIRHLPVVEEGKVVGIVSMFDLIRRAVESQEILIEQLESYLSATYPTLK